MSGVDHLDQMVSYYSSPRKTCKWYKKVLFHLLDVTVWNSFYIYNRLTAATILTYMLKFPRDTKQKELHTKYYELGNHDLQSAFISGLIKKTNKKRVYTKNLNNKRNFTMVYYLPIENGKEEKVCKSFLKNIFCISDGRISRILAYKNISMTPPIDQRGKHVPHNKTSNLKIQAVEDFINRFPSYESHYSREKSVNRKYLASDLNIKCMYKLYKEQIQESVSFFIFQDTFNKKFNLHFHAPVTDSCKKCDNFNVKMKYVDNDDEKKKIETEKDLHLRKAESARDGMRIDGLLAKENDTITCIAFNLMKTLPTPVLSTGICYYKRQLWTYCLGIHNIADNTAKMYAWDESVGSRGPQEIGSCILHYIKNFVTSSKLVMYSDQCGGQNRNIKMATLCNCIVASDKYSVNEIDHKFLVSGHSYLPCDQDFGLIEKEKKNHKNIFVPNDWHSVIQNARKKNPFHVINMTKDNLFSTKSLEKQIVNRKKNEYGEKVEWLKIQWLHFKKEQPFQINYKYSNNPEVQFCYANIYKRKSKLEEYIKDLALLYPTGPQNNSV